MIIHDTERLQAPAVIAREAHGRLRRIDEVLQRYIDAGRIPGATAQIIRKGEVVYNKAFGHADIDVQRPMTTDTIFRIASQSKAITSLAAMTLWEEGRFLLDEPLSLYLPAFGAPVVLDRYEADTGRYTTIPARRAITIRDLLRHTSGISYPAVFSDKVLWDIYAAAGVPSGIGTMTPSLHESMSLLATMPLKHHPGEAFTYGLNTDLLGYLLEVLTGQSLDQVLYERVLGPLGMTDTHFHLPPEKFDRLAGLYETTAEGGLTRVSYPLYEGVEADFPKLSGRYLSGGAGLSSTTADLARFYMVYLNGGKYGNARIVSRKTIELMLAGQLRGNIAVSPDPPQPENFEFTLGGFSLATAGNRHLLPWSAGSFGWGGAFNTHGWADPQEELIAVLFTQEYLSPYYSIGEAFQVAVYQALCS